MGHYLLKSLNCKENKYLGTILGKNDDIGKYNKLSLINRDTNETFEYPLSVSEKELHFEIDLNDQEFEPGWWDIYLEPLDQSQKRIFLDIDSDAFHMQKGIPSLDSIYYINNKKIYIPYISVEGHMQIKTGSKNNARIANDEIKVKSYTVVDNNLELSGIQWPATNVKEARIVIECNDGSIRWQQPIKPKQKNAVIPLDEIKNLILSNENYTIWYLLIEFVQGSRFMRYALLLHEDTKKNELYPVYINDIHHPDSKAIFFHSNKKFRLRFDYDDLNQLTQKLSYGLLSEFHMKKDLISFKGKIYCPLGKLTRVRFQHRGFEYFKDFDLESSYQENGYFAFSASVDLKEIMFRPLYWDIYLVFETGEDDILLRLKNNTNKIYSTLNKKTLSYNYLPDDEFTVFPYITNYNSLSFLCKEKNYYDSVNYKLKEILAVWLYKFLKIFFRKNKIWLVCEKFAETAQDNGFYFFKYCFEKQKQKKVYFIIDKKSPDYKRLNGMQNRVIQFMSLRYLIYLQAPVIAIASEARGHYLPPQIERGRIKSAFFKHPYVFLQHGVIGFKKVETVFRKSFMNADFFITSSDFEKNIIVENYGYDKDDVIVTGLARWDAVKNKADSTKQKEIILMPTWRNWLDAMNESEFLKTEYYEKYSHMLEDSRLETFAEENDVIINFIIHPKLKQYVSNFSTEYQNIQVYQFNEVPINELLMKCSMLITDYSSVAWEMYYNKKPVVFYRFDIDKYVEYQGSYIDLEKDIIGEVTDNIPDLIHILEGYVKNGFTEKDQYAAQRSNYLKYIDHNNSKRIFEEIEKKFC